MRPSRPPPNGRARPSIPTGNPMIDGVGPASYAKREDVPELGVNGNIRHRSRCAWRRTTRSPSEGPNPDRHERARLPTAPSPAPSRTRGSIIPRTIVRYLEVDIGARTVLLPMTMARVSRRQAHRQGRLDPGAAQFADAPQPQERPTTVTKLEEDKIVGYFAGGHLYATPSTAWDRCYERLSTSSRRCSSARARRRSGADETVLWQGRPTIGGLVPRRCSTSAGDGLFRRARRMEPRLGARRRLLRERRAGRLRLGGHCRRGRRTSPLCSCPG